MARPHADVVSSRIVQLGQEISRALERCHLVAPAFESADEDFDGPLEILPAGSWYQVNSFLDRHRAAEQAGVDVGLRKLLGEVQVVNWCRIRVELETETFEESALEVDTGKRFYDWVRLEIKCIPEKPVHQAESLVAGVRDSALQGDDRFVDPCHAGPDLPFLIKVATRSVRPGLD